MHASTGRGRAYVAMLACKCLNSSSCPPASLMSDMAGPSLGAGAGEGGLLGSESWSLFHLYTVGRAVRW